MRFRTTMLRAPEGDPSGGGSGEPTAPDPSAYDTAAAELFGDKPSGDGKPPAAPAGDDADAGKKPADSAGKPDDAAPPAKKSGLFGKLGKKADGGDTAPAGDGKPPADGTSTPEDTLELDKSAKPETREQFDNLKNITKQVRTELNQRAAENAELRAQIAKLNSVVGDPAELERIRTEHKNFSERLSVLDIQNHPQFKSKFGEPIAKLTESVSTILADGEVEGVDVSALLSKSRADFAREVSKIAERLNDFDADGFKSGMRELFQLHSASKDALKDAGSLREQLAKQSADRQRGAFEETWKSIGGMEDFLVKLEADADTSDEDRADIEAYNKAVGGVKADAEQIAFGMSDEKSMSRVATEAATFRFLTQHALPRMEREYGAAQQQIAALTKELAAIKKSRPSPAGGESHGDRTQSNAPIDYDAEASKVWRQ